MGKLAAGIVDCNPTNCVRSGHLAGVVERGYLLFGLPDHLAGALGTTTAIAGHAKPLAHITQVGGAVNHRVPYLRVGDAFAETNIHGRDSCRLALIEAYHYI